MKVFKMTKNGVTHFPVIRELAHNHVISYEKGYRHTHQIDESKISELSSSDTLLRQGTLFVDPACKIYNPTANLSKQYINYVPSDYALLTDMVI